MFRLSGLTLCILIIQVIPDKNHKWCHFHRYARTWFLIDLVSSFPFDYVVSSATSSGSGRLLSASRALRILRMAKLLSLLRLLRISRLVRYVHQYEEVCENFLKAFVIYVKRGSYVGLDSGTLGQGLELCLGVLVFCSCKGFKICPSKACLSHPLGVYMGTGKLSGET